MSDAGPSLASGTPVRSRSGDEVGKLTGGKRKCQMDGCRGQQLCVRWTDRVRTWPCTHGMTYDDVAKEWRIG